MEITCTLSSLIEEQIKTIMLAKGRDEYVLRILDPSLEPFLKDSPSRALICIFGVIIGTALFSILVLVLEQIGLKINPSFSRGWLEKIVSDK